MMKKGKLRLTSFMKTLSLKAYQTVPGLITFVEHLKVLFPDAIRARRKINGKIYKTVYTGICLKRSESSANDSESLQFPDIPDRIHDSFKTSVISNEIQWECESGFLSNGHQVYKRVTFKSNGTWELYIGEKKVDLELLHIDSKYEFSVSAINLVIECVKRIPLCSGVKVTKSVVVSRYHTLDKWQRHDDNPVRSVRSVLCLKTVPFNARTTGCCIFCQRMTFGKSQDKENAPQKNETSEQHSFHYEIQKIFPQASDDMIELLIEQAKNVGKHSRGHRLSQKFIILCLQLYNRSPHSNEMLCLSRILVLPSKSTLIMYKNKLKQSPGFDDNVFEWMYLEANRQNIPGNERYGGIIFDEMSVQSDIEIDKNGNLVELSGFTEYGSEGDLCHALRTGSKEKQLGKYVLQLLFLVTNGFRFPFAHFVTSGIQASELYGPFLESSLLAVLLWI